MESEAAIPQPVHNVLPTVETFGEPSQSINLTGLIQEFLDRERSASLYRASLEFRIEQECAYLQEERHIRGHLEHQLAESQWARSQIETSYRRSCEDRDFFRQEVAQEKGKIQDIESRLAAALSFHETIQKSSWGRASPDRSVDALQLRLQSQRQQELITELQVLNLAHENTIRTLQGTLHNALGCFSCCSYTDSDGTSTAVEAFASEGSKSPQEPPENTDPLLAVNHLGETWYEG
ncbi:hypothetical protein P170DRAFT_425789 [Aspergillus steynii IBT 23096]|uniref:Uncharacterized protein n=1 Tax=Aspergillus steynii IBT 23096 TaxID=1392250 RepID=A0A2I2G7B8_9EURO|nr:uncharacterized protein P170DRAFT_425789 [Aspergillus steynii IBT 23096]PLB48770.1 hypothetical protein P170DRAFT_425789 [Aspergillus steynii IBT 23096]